MASVGWIDFSSEHRDKVRTVLTLLGQRGVVDELGIGMIRDSFADRLFPGISTIQTRAKYFTLTALLIDEYDRQAETGEVKTANFPGKTDLVLFCRLCSIVGRFLGQSAWLGFLNRRMEVTHVDCRFAVLS